MFTPGIARANQAVIRVRGLQGAQRQGRKLEGPQPAPGKGKLYRDPRAIFTSSDLPDVQARGFRAPWFLCIELGRWIEAISRWIWAPKKEEISSNSSFLK